MSESNEVLSEPKLERRTRRRFTAAEKQRWYVAHVERFLDALKPSSLKRLSSDQITGYLRETSSQGRWQDWQFRQLVDALQLLLVDLAQVKAAQVVDWDFWREAGGGTEHTERGAECAGIFLPRGTRQAAG